jgi:hypothetical protein
MASQPKNRPPIRKDDEPGSLSGAPNDGARPPGAGETGGASGDRPRPGGIGDPGNASTGAAAGSAVLSVAFVAGTGAG